MPENSSPFDASLPALGYIHQCRCALLLGLQRFDEPKSCISIEKVDDVAVHPSVDSPESATELRQYKLHINRQGSLGDKSPDIWKTLRVWAESIRKNKIDPERATFCLVTTSLADESNAIRLLRREGRKPEDARRVLEAAGAASTNKVVVESFASLSSLSEQIRQVLFSRIYLLDNSLAATDLQDELMKHIWFVPAHHRTVFAECLEGWWLNFVVSHLIASDVTPIPVQLIQQKVQDIVAQYRRECLPDQLLSEPIPEGAIPDGDDRIFVQQLILIGLSEARRRFAQEDHYRAFTQRSRWAKQDLLGFDEEEKFETRLVNCWKERFEIMREGISLECDAPTLVRHGSSLYEWIVTEAPSRSQLWFRPDFQADYMTKGSFQMLADLLRVGWHPKFKETLTPPPPTDSPKPPERRRRATP